MSGVITFSDFCEQGGFPLGLRNELLEEFNNRQRAREVVCQARCQSRAGAPDRAPLLDESGQAWGHVEATIDRDSFFAWAARPDVGPDCWSDDTFLREYLRDNPHARVRTVSSRCTVRNPWQSPIVTQWRGPVRSITVYR